jgi:hypothetical protein
MDHFPTFSLLPKKFWKLKKIIRRMQVCWVGGRARSLCTQKEGGGVVYDKTFGSRIQKTKSLVNI